MGRLDFRSCLLIGALATACADGDEVSALDPSFDMWCGQRLCNWQTDQGRVAPVGTWHARDLAVSFLDTGAQISQRIAPRAVGCFLLDTIADAETSARLSIQADFNVDGVIDFTQQVPAVRWQSVQFEMRAPVAYDGLALIIHKAGTGRAVLAQLRVVAQDTCSGDPLTLADGSECSRDEVCSSGSCVEGRCQPCRGDACVSLAAARRAE